MNQHMSGCSSCKKLIHKVQKHEEIISQLVKIVAATNRQITELSKQRAHWQNSPYPFH